MKRLVLYIEIELKLWALNLFHYWKKNLSHTSSTMGKKEQNLMYVSVHHIWKWREIPHLRQQFIYYYK